MANAGDVSVEEYVKEFGREMDAITGFYHRLALFRGAHVAQEVSNHVPQTVSRNSVLMRHRSRRAFVVLALITALALPLWAQVAAAPISTIFAPSLHATNSIPRK